MPPSGYLNRLFVHKDYQGRGIVTAICSKLESRAQGAITTHASITAKPFFESREYMVVREQVVQRKGILLKNDLMKKERKFQLETEILSKTGCIVQ